MNTDENSLIAATEQKCCEPDQEQTAPSADPGDAFVMSLAADVMDILTSIKMPWRMAEIARELNKRGKATAHGGQWYPKAVKRLLRKLGPVVEDARKIRMAKIDAAFKNFLGVEAPKSLDEVAAEFKELGAWQS